MLQTAMAKCLSSFFFEDSEIQSSRANLPSHEREALDFSNHLRRELENDPGCELGGLSLSAFGYLVAKALPKLQSVPGTGPFVVVSPDMDTASSLLEALSCFHVSASIVPEWHPDPYSGIMLSREDRLQRLATLSQLTNRSPQTIVIFPATALCLKPGIYGLSIKEERFFVGQTLPREQIESTLRRLGYQRIDPVEIQGCYNPRGFLLDVFPVGALSPVRMEWFGDEIVEIRTFDPITQRSTKDCLSEVSLLPALEWPQDNVSLDAGFALIKNYCDDLGIPKPLRDQLKDDVSANPALASPALYPFFVPNEENRPLPRLLGVFRPTQVLENTSRYLDLAVTSYEKSKSRLICAPPSALLQPQTELISWIDNALLLAPSYIDPQSTRPHRQISTVLTHSLKDSEAIQPHAKYRIYCSHEASLQRVKHHLEKKNLFVSSKNSSIELLLGNLPSGFEIPAESLIVFSEEEAFGLSPVASKHRSKRRGSRLEYKGKKIDQKYKAFVSTLDDLEPGDLVVHTLHGIGAYRDCVRMNAHGIENDYLLLEYAKGDRLYLPAYRLDVLQKYIGNSDGEATSSIPLDQLGSQDFQKSKAKAKEALKDLAQDLLKIYALRASTPGLTFSPPDPMYYEFEERFPYPETDGQLQAIQETNEDFLSGRVMDRLVCGDVGFGKTEVAMRAAFRSVMEKCQVAVLVPTTTLCFQHERTFRERMREFPIRIESLSRFKSATETSEVLSALGEGKVDIVIGTHKLLSKATRFRNLGLLIIDEEHRFGVEHKEKLRKIKANTHTLTLSATPIPRTLQMSLMGIRDISLITTPPAERLSIQTQITSLDSATVRRAIEFELNRNGQIYFVHNRVEDIHEIYEKLSLLAPQARIAIGHAQLAPGQLEKRMMDFYDRKFDILLCTTIIESGLDVPTANTIIINRADHFGLSQLYQLRGRVGRSNQKAFCYLLIRGPDSVTQEARRRLDILQRFADLGSGFKIASHDLELRGGGDVLGRAQSGHVAAIGFEMYSDLLNQTIQELRGQGPSNPSESDQSVEIKVPVSTRIPDSYVPEVQQRIALYKRLSSLAQEADVLEMESELADRFGSIPQEVINLLEIIRLKHLLASHRVLSLVCGPESMVVQFGKDASIKPEKLAALAKNSTLRISPDFKVVLPHRFLNIIDLRSSLSKFLTEIA